MFSSRPPSWSHLPEEPLAPVPQPSAPMRALLWLRAHGFLFVLVATLAVVAVVFREFSRLSAASDAAAQAQVAQSRMAAAAPVVDGYGALSVTTFPSEADVFVDGDPVGQTPLSRVRLAPGTYALTVQKAGHARFDSLLVVEPDQRHALLVPLSAAPVERAARLPQVADARPGSERSPERGPRRSGAAPPAAPPPAATPEPARSPATTVVMGRVHLDSSPPGAEVLVAGRRMGVTPLTLDLEPGEYVATFRKKGYEAPTLLLGVQAGQTRRVAPELTALPATVHVRAEPWGTIYFNGELVQDATNVRVSRQVTPGPVRITVVHPLLGRWERVVTVEPGGEASYVVDLNAQADGDS